MNKLKEFIQAGRFYESLSVEERRELAEAIAEDIFFLDNELQLNVIELLSNVSAELSEEIRERNTFTT